MIFERSSSDGSQHYDAAGQLADAQRDAKLRSLGLRVLRYSNAEVNQNFRGVCEDVLNHLKPSPGGEDQNVIPSLEATPGRADKNRAEARIRPFYTRGLKVGVTAR